GEHVTINQCSALSNIKFVVLNFTNSLLVSVTNIDDEPYTLNTNKTFFLSSGSGVFQTAAAGNHYLSSSTPYRNIGATNLSGTLVNDLKALTTYPPIVLSNSPINVNTTLTPQAQRDTDIPDIGYHYVPLDYVCKNVRTTAATLSIAPGTAIGL